jgi:hypothetical protein
VQEELEALHIHSQAVVHLQSQRRDRDAEKENSLTPRFILSVLSVTPRLHMAKVLSLTEFFGH